MTIPRSLRPAKNVAGSRPDPPRASKPIRWSKVMTAQARIAVGYYDRDDVREQVLAAVLEVLERR